MPQHFIPKYDLKIRGGVHIIEWRFGAHPTAHAHALSPSGVPLLLRRPQHTSAPTLGGLQTGGVGPPPAPPVGRSVSVESGARSGNFTVLPPIKNSGQKVNEDFSLSELDEISLKNEVARQSKDVSEKTLQAMLRNLRAQDRDRDGVLSPDIVKGTLRKFQISLSENGQKNICKKFGEKGERAAVVRYEQMFAFITKTRLDAVRAPPPKPPQQPTISKSAQQQQQRLVNLRNKVLFSDRDDAKLIIDLERQMADKQVNMADLRRTMYDLDRDRNDFLSGQQVKTAFERCGVDFTPDVLARLLLATDRTGAGMHNIESLMNYLTKIKPEAHNAMLGNNYQPRQARVAQLPMFQGQPALQPPWAVPNSPQQLEAQTDFLPDEGFSDYQGEVSRSGDSSYAPSPAPYVQPPPSAPPEEEPEEDFDMHKWSTDYEHLAQAVYGADHDQSGYMAAHDVSHIASTYNMVYNLGISEASLHSALAATNDPNYGEVNLEFFIATLQDLHFKEKGSY